MAGFRGARRSFARSFPVRRRTSWDDGPDDLSGTTQATATTSAILGTGAQVTEDGFTLVRLRGGLRVFLSTVTTALDGYFGAIGIGICTAEAFAVGVTAVPIPVTDKIWDGWLWWQPVMLQSAAATSGNNWGGVDQTWEVDSRAQRRLNAGDTIYVAWEVTEIGTAVLNYRGNMRTLLKLP